MLTAIGAAVAFIFKVLAAMFFGFWKLMLSFGFFAILGIVLLVAVCAILKVLMDAWSDAIFPFK